MDAGSPANAANARARWATWAAVALVAVVGFNVLGALREDPPALAGAPAAVLGGRVRPPEDRGGARGAAGRGCPRRPRSPVARREKELGLETHLPLAALRDLHAPEFNASSVNCADLGWAPRAEPAALVDLMLFNGEADMLAVHMAELDAVVDVFLVVEANVTFSHRPKPMYFPDLYLDEFAGAWRDQVAFHPVEVPVSVGAHWLTENYIRNQSRPALEHLLRTSPRLRGRSASDVFLVISDTDEVPCPHKLAYFRHCRAEPPSQPFPVPLGLGTFYYYSLRWDTGRAWGGAPVVWPAPMVLAEGFNGDQKRDRHAPVHPALRKCGWHMSYFMSPTRIREKLLAFSHKEYSGPPYTTLEHIRDKLSRAESLFTPTPMKLAVPDPRDSKAEIPRLIRANECYFKEWLGPFGCSYGEDDDEDGEGSDEDEDE